MKMFLIIADSEKFLGQNENCTERVYLYKVYLPVPLGAYFFCSARMNLVRVMQLVSMVSWAMVMLYPHTLCQGLPMTECS